MGYGEQNKSENTFHLFIEELLDPFHRIADWLTLKGTSGDHPV